MPRAIEAPGDADQRRAHHQADQVVMHAKQIEGDGEESQGEHDGGERQDRSPCGDERAPLLNGHDAIHEQHPVRGFAAARVLLQHHHDARRLHQRGEHEQRRGRTLHTRIRRAHQRQHENAEPGTEGDHDAAERIEIVPAHADVNRQTNDDEGAADVGE